MKQLSLVKILSVFFALFVASTAHAQGVVVYLKDSTKVRYSYEVLDRIETYNYDEEEPDDNGNGDVVEDNLDIFSSLSYDDMVYVEGGTFTMGATSEQGSDAGSSEKPTHQVTVSSFYMGKYEVTQQLWEYVMNYTGAAADGSTMTAAATDPWLGSNPSSSYGLGNYYPAYYVSYEDIVNYFLPRLNKITGRTYRLPTEAEWEYAARGGNQSRGYKYSGSNDVNSVAWYGGNSGGTTHAVGTKQANELGLYDMSGNVFEWCSDWYDSSYYSNSPQTNPQGPGSGNYRVDRGGSWYNNASYCRVTYRDYGPPSGRSNYLGFRVLLEP